MVAGGVGITGIRDKKIILKKVIYLFGILKTILNFVYFIINN